MREEDRASGVEAEGELAKVERACLPKLLHSLAGSPAQAMGFEAALHLDAAAFAVALGLPELGEFEGAPTPKTLKGITAKAVFDSLTPCEMLKGGGQ